MKKSFLDQLEWRFATKVFDASKKVSEEDLEKILNAIHLSPSSFGLQLYHIQVITDPDLRAKLREHAWNQSQITDCSHLLVFQTRTDLDERIEELLTMMSKGTEEGRKALEFYENMMRGFAEGRSEEWIKAWGDRQTYIALGFAMAACAELGVDSCPMEGFEPTAFNEILELPENLKSSVCLAIGHRLEDSQYPKFRFPKEDLIS